MYVIIDCYNLFSFIRYHSINISRNVLVDVCLAMVLNTTILLINSTYVMISGTTPPSQTSTGNHPSLLSSHSCPGPNESTNTITTGISAKPPQSPTLSTSSLNRHALDPKPATVEKPPRTDKKPEKIRPTSIDKSNQMDASIPPMRRDRGHTISVMSPVSKPRLDTVRRTGSPRPRDAPKSGINPSFVFLQLYHAAHFGNGAEKPLLVGSSQMVQRAVKILDCIPPYETHKVGVLYVGPGQCNNETEILRNRYGSVRYVEFLHRLGTLISLRDADPQSFFLGGLAQNGNDGKFAYIWQDDVMQVIFHVATLMPCKERDPACNNKKMHIGNNFVSIVYNESGEDYTIGTIKGQFNYANIIIEPLDYATNRVIVKTKDELSEYIGHSEPKIISDQNLAILTRQMALHANVRLCFYSLFFLVLHVRLCTVHRSKCLNTCKYIKSVDSIWNCGLHINYEDFPSYLHFTFNFRFKCVCRYFTACFNGNQFFEISRTRSVCILLVGTFKKN